MSVQDTIMRPPAPAPAAPAGRARGRRFWPILALMSAIVLAIAYAGPSVYIASKLTQPARKPITISPAALGMTMESVEFASREDGLTLRGWLLPARRDAGAGDPALIIVLHGINGIRDDTTIGLLPIAAGLVWEGYDVLMFDLRGHGLSDDGRAGMGSFERRDLKGALDWAEARGYRRIGVHGFSLGAATAILTAAEDPRIAAVASDASYAALGDMLAVEIPRRSGLPSIFTPGALLAARALYGADFAAVRPVDAMPRLRDRPVLIIHGADDQRTPAAHAERLWAARYGDTGEREWLRVVPGAAHVQSYHADPEAYMTLARRFWQVALGAPIARAA
jgi:dipeptidyl aminopeptidase/acylaminoacyl peptidase